MYITDFDSTGTFNCTIARVPKNPATYVLCSYNLPFKFLSCLLFTAAIWHAGNVGTSNMATVAETARINLCDGHTAMAPPIAHQPT